VAFTTVVAWLGVPLVTVAQTARVADAARPNVIVVMADDMAQCDTSVYDCTHARTPNLDALAKGGVRFTQAYTSAPVCTPSRAGLMTGRHQQRYGMEFNAGPLARAVEQELGLPEGEITLPQLLKQAGYATGMVGKWHLGMQDKFHPMTRGFDEFFGFLFGASSYGTEKTPGLVHVNTSDGQGNRTRNPRNPILRGRTPVEEHEYLTDAFTREALAFIDRHTSSPFFLYVAYNAPHTPLQAVPKYLDRFKDVPDERTRTYRAMVSALDDGMGAIRQKLRERGIEKNTLLVFLADNGCATYTEACTSQPLRYGKLTPFEGGPRVPFLMEWPGRLPAGRTFEGVSSALDLLPTTAALAGASLPAGRAYDGVDLMPYLLGQKAGDPHAALFWRNGPNGAVRAGQWKLVKGGDSYWLYDVAADKGEHTNVAASHPDILERLKAQWAEWARSMAEPMWPCRKADGTWLHDGVKLDICI
jgi:arylsulfatase A-like enzyme